MSTAGPKEMVFQQNHSDFYSINLLEDRREMMFLLYWLDGWAWDPWAGWDPLCLREEDLDYYMFCLSDCLLGAPIMLQF